jgi:hypothetical protein
VNLLHGCVANQEVTCKLLFTGSSATVRAVVLVARDFFTVVSSSRLRYYSNKKKVECIFKGKKNALMAHEVTRNQY